jgi:hypothetical protein
MAHALKFEYKHLSREPSNSQHLSLGIPEKVTGRELFEQNVIVLSAFVLCSVDGIATLYLSMTSNVVAPMEQASIAVTTSIHDSCSPCGSES